MSKKATMLKMTNSFLKMWVTLAAGPMYWAISTAAPFKGLIMLSGMVSWFLLRTEQVLFRQVNTHTDISQMLSFVDWCLSFFHGMASHTTQRSSWNQTTNYVSHSWKSHGIFLSRVLPPHMITGTTTQ